MAGFGDIVQKAFYLGVGIASYATEKAGGTLQELRTQAQKLADEMVSKGEMTTEEARKFVDDLLKQAGSENLKSSETQPDSQPRRIEISIDDETPSEQGTQTPKNADDLRKQVESLKEQLRRLKQE